MTKQRHDGDAQHDAWIVAGFGRLGDIGAEAVRRQLGVAPADATSATMRRSRSRPRR